MARDCESLKCLFVWARVVALVVTFAGCVPIPVQRSTPLETDYMEVDYRRFVSGLYVNELKNKNVKIDCAFGSMGGSVDYSSNYMTFLVTGPSGFSIETPGMLTVVIPKNFAAIIFSLRHGDQIQVRGKAVESINRGARGSVVRMLYLQAAGIQKKEKVEKSDKSLVRDCGLA